MKQLFALSLLLLVCHVSQLVAAETFLSARHDLQEQNDVENDDDDSGSDDEPPVVKPSCEKLWKKHHGEIVLDDLKTFQHPERKEITCVPLKLVRFSQASVYNTTSSGKSLDDWIAKFKEHQYFKKRNVPDIVDFGDNWFVSIDNRRIYCAKKAELAFVPAVVHAFHEPLPKDALRRFHLRVQGRFQGTKYAKTWGEGATLRCMEQSAKFPLFGSMDLPEVVPAPPAPAPQGGFMEVLNDDDYQLSYI
eukprot:GILI01041343.1.p1 GENE.GILI01041343.1~~GILI01041343.1.p1  ORF type:complete len:275 (+),score=73.27 GILI01041343.1:82-825(+)